MARYAGNQPEIVNKKRTLDREDTVTGTGNEPKTDDNVSCGREISTIYTRDEPNAGNIIDFGREIATKGPENLLDSSDSIARENEIMIRYLRKQIKIRQQFGVEEIRYGYGYRKLSDL